MNKKTESENGLLGHVDADLYNEDFAEMLRDLLRAIAAVDNTAALSSASGRLRNLLTYSDQLPPELSWYKILDASVSKLKPSHVPFDSSRAYEHQYDRVARYGVKLAAELTSSDGFSAARIGKARRALADENESIDELRKLRREQRESGLTR